MAGSVITLLVALFASLDYADQLSKRFKLFMAIALGLLTVLPAAVHVYSTVISYLNDDHGIIKRFVFDYMSLVLSKDGMDKLYFRLYYNNSSLAYCDPFSGKKKEGVGKMYCFLKRFMKLEKENSLEAKYFARWRLRASSKMKNHENSIINSALFNSLLESFYKIRYKVSQENSIKVVRLLLRGCIINLVYVEDEKMLRMSINKDGDCFHEECFDNVGVLAFSRVVLTLGKFKDDSVSLVNLNMTKGTLYHLSLPEIVKSCVVGLELCGPFHLDKTVGGILSQDSMHVFFTKGLGSAAKALIKHNCIFWGEYKPERLQQALSAKCRRLPKGVGNTEWKKYISDVSHLGGKVSFFTKLNPSKAVEEAKSETEESQAYLLSEKMKFESKVTCLRKKLNDATMAEKFREETSQKREESIKKFQALEESMGKLKVELENLKGEKEEAIEKKVFSEATVHVNLKIKMATETVEETVFERKKVNAYVLRCKAAAALEAEKLKKEKEEEERKKLAMAAERAERRKRRAAAAMESASSSAKGESSGKEKKKEVVRRKKPQEAPPVQPAQVKPKYRSFYSVALDDALMAKFRSLPMKEQEEDPDYKEFVEFCVRSRLYGRGFNEEGVEYVRRTVNVEKQKPEVAVNLKVEKARRREEETTNESEEEKLLNEAIKLKEEELAKLKITPRHNPSLSETSKDICERSFGIKLRLNEKFFYLKNKKSSNKYMSKLKGFVVRLKNSCIKKMEGWKEMTGDLDELELKAFLIMEDLNEIKRDSIFRKGGNGHVIIDMAKYMSFLMDGAPAEISRRKIRKLIWGLISIDFKAY